MKMKILEKIWLIYKIALHRNMKSKQPESFVPKNKTLRDFKDRTLNLKRSWVIMNKI